MALAGKGAAGAHMMQSPAAHACTCGRKRAPHTAVLYCTRLVVPQAVEDWLYEEGEDTTKSVYIDKLVELKAKGAAVEQRCAGGDLLCDAVWCGR